MASFRRSRQIEYGTPLAERKDRGTDDDYIPRPHHFCARIEARSHAVHKPDRRKRIGANALCLAICNEHNCSPANRARGIRVKIPPWTIRLAHRDRQLWHSRSQRLSANRSGRGDASQCIKRTATSSVLYGQHRQWQVRPYRVWYSPRKTNVLEAVA